MRVDLAVEPGTDDQRTAVAFFESIGDTERMTELFAEDIVWTIWGDLPFSGTHRGKEAVMRDFHGAAGPLFAPDGDGVITVTSILGSGPTVAIEFDHKNVTAIGRDYHNHYVEIFEISDGQIAAVREYCDTAHLRSAAYE
jgi:ketosteroid isomerase-like protein